MVLFLQITVCKVCFHHFQLDLRGKILMAYFTISHMTLTFKIPSSICKTETKMNKCMETASKYLFSQSTKWTQINRCTSYRLNCKLCQTVWSPNAWQCMPIYGRQYYNDPIKNSNSSATQSTEPALARRPVFTSWPDKRTCSAEWDYLKSVNTGFGH